MYRMVESPALGVGAGGGSLPEGATEVDNADPIGNEQETSTLIGTVCPSPAIKAWGARFIRIECR